MRRTRGLVALLVGVLLLFVLASEATAAHYGYRPLSRGAQGEDVEELQYMLRKLHYYTGPVDGIFGPIMQAAIRNLQRTYGLPQTGKVDGRLMEITTALHEAFLSGEAEITEINPNHPKQKGETFELKYYTVKKGETVSSIARKHSIPPVAVLRLNALANPDLIRPGQRLLVLSYK